MYEDIKCEDCGQSNWTHETISLVRGHPNVEERWITCECGAEQEVIQ
ncbi:MAG: hypothetical protein ACTSQA_00085 [Candidatus Heimdallarchaeaceae archaeon]